MRHVVVLKFPTLRMSFHVTKLSVTYLHVIVVGVMKSALSRLTPESISIDYL